MAGEENYIPGIYNYCDRWCEKCAFSSRCEQFAPTEFDEYLSDEDIEDDDKDSENEEFWRKLNEILEATYDMLKDIALQHHVDIEEIIGEVEEVEISEVDDEELLNLSDEQREIIESNNIIKLCGKFESLTGNWFEASSDILDKKEKDINDIINMEIPGINIEKDIIPMNDAFDVINWYNYFIQAKLRRALYFRDSSKKEAQDIDDSNGSAKISLIAMDRSIAAWSSMIDFVPQTEDMILQILIILSEIRKRTEKEFPDARNFKRPGLDK